MFKAAMVGASTLVLVSAGPALADPNNAGTATRTMTCSNGETVVAVFQGESGSNFNVTTSTSVFIYLELDLDRLPTGEGGDDEVIVRGVLAPGQQESLVTCGYTTGSGTVVTATGFFTPRS